MDTKTHVAALIVGLVVGGGVGWALAGAGAQPAAPEAFVASAAPVAPQPAAAPEVAAPAKGSVSCEQTLTQIQAALESAQKDKSEATGLAEHLDELLQRSGGASKDGIKQPWPEGLERLYTPEGFTAAIDELKKACPKAFPADVTKADCSEFPCSLQLVHPGAGRDWDGMKTCAKFGALFGDNVSWSSIGGMSLDGKEISYSNIIPMVPDKKVREFARDYEGNLQKRRRVRMNEFQYEQRRAMFEGPCEQGQANACTEVAGVYKERDPARYEELMGRGCELGDGGACNNLAWSRCRDEGLCDDEALANAERAAELKPDDGKGALDTLAYVLCKTGRRVEADAAYARSCQAGYESNCGKRCEP